MPDVDLELPCEAYIGEEPFLFVSYAHRDGAEVYDDIRYLSESGYRVWYDEGISPGSEWPYEIEKARTTRTRFPKHTDGRIASACRSGRGIEIIVASGAEYSHQPNRRRRNGLDTAGIIPDGRRWSAG